MSDAKANGKALTGNGRKAFRHYGKKAEDKSEGIPILKYGKGNNFYKFKTAVSTQAMKEFGNLGKLINLEAYYVPVFDPPDLTDQGLTAAQLNAMRLDALKSHLKVIEKMKADRPKLYGLIWEKMSVESRDEVSQDAAFEEWSTDADPERLWQAIVRTHKIDCVSDVGEIKELAARKAYTGIKQGAFETLAQYSERFHETYKGYKNTGTVEAPIVVAPKIQALDFFHGLDPGRYGAFKTNMLNGWNLRSIALPETPNEIYRIAGSWVKPVSRIEGHMAAMYMTVEEEEEAFVMMLEQETPSKNKRQGKKPQKDLSHIKCFACNRMGH
jgi:hypothetical protein